MKKSLIIIGINVGIMLVIVIVVIACMSSWLDGYTRHGESVKVPSVIGMSDDEAIYYLEEAGLKPMVIDSIYSDAAPGSVIEQLPEGGIPVKSGRIIYLTINAKSVRMITMPDVEDFSSRQAKSLLREAGFIVEKEEEVAYEFDDLVRGVKINDVEAMPGEDYPFHTKVTLLVGSTKVELTPENDETEDAWFE